MTGEFLGLYDKVSSNYKLYILVNTDIRFQFNVRILRTYREVCLQAIMFVRFVRAQVTLNKFLLYYNYYLNVNAQSVYAWSF